MELDLFDELISAIESSVREASPETQKSLEPDIVGLIELGRSRRPHEFLMGRYLCNIRMKLAAENIELAERLNKALGKTSNHCYRSMRLYQRLAAYEQYVPLIAARVQRFFADHKYMPDMLREVIAMAKEGREVSYTVFAEEILPTYASLTDATLVEEPLSEIPFDPSTVEPDVDDDTDPWDMDDEDDDDVLEPSTTKTSAARNTATVPKVDRVDLDDMREKLIRNLNHELSNAFTSIEDFCETYNIRKGGWFLRFKSGADKAKSAIDEWRTEKLDRH